MKKIICFGDSNTFGFNPTDGSRYDKSTRWTAILGQLLGEDCKISEEGCNNRTGFFHNPDGFLQSGQEYIMQCLEKHSSFDIFILALGTNDLQKIFKLDENIVDTGLKKLVEKIREHNQNAKIILVSPVILNEDILKGGFSHQFDINSIKLSAQIQKTYKDFAQKENCELFNLNKFVKPSPVDGLHFDALSHKIIAEELSKQILNKTGIKQLMAQQ